MARGCQIKQQCTQFQHGDMLSRNHIIWQPSEEDMAYSINNTVQSTVPHSKLIAEASCHGVLLLYSQWNIAVNCFLLKSLENESKAMEWISVGSPEQWCFENQPSN